MCIVTCHVCSLFFFTGTATTEIYTYLHTLSLHDALPISLPGVAGSSLTKSPPLRKKKNAPLLHPPDRHALRFQQRRHSVRADQMPGADRDQQRPQIGRAHV